MYINSGAQTHMQNSSSSEEAVDYIHVSRPSTKNSENDPKMQKMVKVPANFNLEEIIEDGSKPEILRTEPNSVRKGNEFNPPILSKEVVFKLDTEADDTRTQINQTAQQILLIQD